MFRKLSDYISTHYISHYWVLLIDVIVSTAASCIIYWGVAYFTHVIVSSLTYAYIGGVSAVASLICFLIFRTHMGIIRHTTMREMWRISCASLLKAFIVFTAVYFSKIDSYLGYGIGRLFITEVTDLIATLFFLITVRIFLANIYGILVSKTTGSDAKRIMIYGDGDESVSVLGIIDKYTDVRYKCLGFITFTPYNKSKKLLCGYKVLDVENERSFQRITLSQNVNAIIFPSHKSARMEKDRMVDYCTRRKIEVLIQPNFSAVEEGEPILPPIREVKIEDLLGRDQVSISMSEINNFLTDKVVMVTGAAGSIGGELCRLLLSIPIQKLILLDDAETPLNDMQLELRDRSPKIEKKFIIGDVRSREKLDYVFSRYSPNVVFHAAAYKHVPMMEANPCESVNVNVFGTMNVADISVKYGVEKFVMISTDKAVNPANVMGASKRIAEIYVQSLGRAIAAGNVKGITKFVTTRFGNVLGSNGSVIPLFRQQIAAGGPITVTDPKIIRYFMTIPEACRLVMEAATMGKGDEIFVFDMGEPVKIVELAKNMIRLAGLEVDKDIQIQFVGLRPGEKLYEELLNNEENTIPTIHKKIFLAKVRSYIYASVLSDLEELKKLSESMNKESTVSYMKKMVPEFKSCNSRYGKLDKVL